MLVELNFGPVATQPECAVSGFTNIIAAVCQIYWNVCLGMLQVCSVITAVHAGV